MLEKFKISATKLDYNGSPKPGTSNKLKAQFFELNFFKLLHLTTTRIRVTTLDEKFNNLLN